MITDIHCHFVPPDFFEFAKVKDEFALKVLKTEGEKIDVTIRNIFFGLNTTFFDLDKQVERMATLGVERTILSLATPFIDYRQDAALAVSAAALFNDALAASISADRKRFGGWAFLPMQHPDAAAVELTRCVREHGFVGGHVGSNVRGVYLHDERFTPIWRAATDLDVPLFVHPADPLGKDRMTQYELMVVAGYLFDSTINILDLVCSGFLDRWPKLKLVFAHAGAFALPLRARMQREVDTNPSLSSTLKRPVGDYLRQLYFDSVCFEPEMLRYAAGVVPVEHIMMGSDGPFPLGEADPVGFVTRALPADDAVKVIGENAARLLKLP